MSKPAQKVTPTPEHATELCDFILGYLADECALDMGCVAESDRKNSLCVHEWGQWRNRPNGIGGHLYRYRVCKKCKSRQEEWPLER